MPVTIKKRKLVKTSSPKKAQPKRDWKIVNRGKGRKPKFYNLTSELGPDNMAKVDSMLLKGETCEAVAKTIKLVWGLQKDMRLVSLAAVLSDYRSTNVKGQLIMLDDPDAPRLSEFASKIDVMENLTALIGKQQDRVSKALVAEETKTKKKGDYPLYINTKLEIQLLARLYEQMSDLQMDLGVLRKVPAKFQLESMSTRTQQLLDDAMKKNTRVGVALAEAFKVLDGKFIKVPDDATTH